MWYQDKAFLKLQKAWYKKLAASGFVDIEHTNFDTGETMLPSMMVNLNRSPKRPGLSEYYQSARAHLSAMDDDRAVWSMHCEGKSVRLICKDTGLTRYTVLGILARHKQACGEDRARAVFLEQGVKPYALRHSSCLVEGFGGLRQWYSEEDQTAYELGALMCYLLGADLPGAPVVLQESPLGR